MRTASLIFIFDQPVYLNEYTIFDIGTGKKYINWDKTEDAFSKEYERSIRRELEQVVESVDAETPCSAYFSGHFLKMLEQVDSTMIAAIKKIAAKRHLEILGGTVNHSFASIYSHKCFEWEVIEHLSILNEKLGVVPTTFYNTENIYFDKLKELIEPLGFKSTFAGVIPWYLEGQENKRVFLARDSKKFAVHLIDQDLNKSIDQSSLENIHLQFDLELIKEFGGIGKIIKNSRKKAELVRLKEQRNLTQPKDQYKIKSPSIGSVRGRSLSTFNGQAMQSNAFDQYYNLCSMVEGSQIPDYMHCHADLGNMSLFLQMHRNGVHDEIDPYQTYNNYINMLTDLEIRIGR